MKIVLIQHVCFLNGIGGTEKICSILANLFVANGYQVEIVTNEDVIGGAVFPLNKSVRVTNIYDPNIEQIEEIPLYNYKGKNPLLWIKYKAKKKYAKWYNRRLRKRMGGEEQIYLFNLRNRAQVWARFFKREKPDVIITMSIASLVEVTFENSLRIPIINSVNGRPDYDYSDTLGQRPFYLFRLLKNAFSELNGIQILFDNYRSFLPDNFKGRIAVIHNPIDHIEPNKLVLHTIEKIRYKIIHVARLDIGCKQQDLAIAVFSALATKYPEWDLEFWGIGPDYEILHMQIANFGLGERVFLRGFTDDPIAEMQKSDIFIFPSKYEGFGLALAEAMSVGLPCIGLSSCSGVNELIVNGENGFLANSAEEMEYFLERLMGDAALRQQIGFKASLSMKRYSKTAMERGWLDLVESVAKNDNYEQNG